MKTILIVGALLVAGSASAGTGYVLTALSPNTDRGFALARQPWDGQLVVGGLANYGTGDFGLVRLSQSGVLDSTFGAGGVVLTDIYGTDQVDAVIATSRGGRGVTRNLIAGGWSTIPNCNFCSRGTLVAYNLNGSLYTSFGGTGKVAVQFGSDDDAQFTALAYDATGLLAAGWSGPGIGSVNHDFIVARFLWNGALDTTFGGGSGYVRLDINSGSDDFATSLAQLANGQLLGPRSVHAGPAQLERQPRHHLRQRR